MSAFSDWFKDRRMALGFTQAQVASKLSIHQAQVSVLEKGKISPDESLMAKIAAIMGKFEGSYVPVPSAPKDGKRVMPSKAKEALRAYREAKQDGFNLQLDNNTSITADKFQYILRSNGHNSYFTDLRSLLKFLIVSQMRQSAVSSVKEVIEKIDEIYKNIEEKFAGYDPASIEIRDGDTEDSDELEE